MVFALVALLDALFEALELALEDDELELEQPAIANIPRANVPAMHPAAIFLSVEDFSNLNPFTIPLVTQIRT